MVGWGWKATQTKCVRKYCKETRYSISQLKNKTKCILRSRGEAGVLEVSLLSISTSLDFFHLQAVINIDLKRNPSIVIGVGHS